MLDTLTAAAFTPHLGSRFRLRAVPDALEIDLELAEVQELGSQSAPAGRRAPFTVSFRGPRSPHLPQRTYQLDHDGMGRFELFLVPVGFDGGGLRYEAVFN
ncbi:MAG: hypothetical protein M3O15_16675 [Acidobacteriota bacterium]|nr:hypothetical protein [Acidobacteriota bacterium]